MTSPFEFVEQQHFVRRFQQRRPKIPMQMDGGVHDGAGDFGVYGNE
ncbi:hypothetical protein [Gemmatimonas sp.]